MTNGDVRTAARAALIEAFADAIMALAVSPAAVAEFHARAWLDADDRKPVREKIDDE